MILTNADKSLEWNSSIEYKENETIYFFIGISVSLTNSIRIAFIDSEGNID